MKTLPVLILLILLGCNSISRHIEEQVDSEVEKAKDDLSADVQKAKEDFTAKQMAIERSAVDSPDIRKLKELKYSIITTDVYLDSLMRELEKMDVNDVSNVELVRKTFVYQGAGDSIINKFRSFVAIAQSVAKTAQQKLAIKSAGDSLFTVHSAEGWKEQTFGFGPLGATMIIYALQAELYNIGAMALIDR